MGSFERRSGISKFLGMDGKTSCLDVSEIPSIFSIFLGGKPLKKHYLDNDYKSKSKSISRSKFPLPMAWKPLQRKDAKEKTHPHSQIRKISKPTHTHKLATFLNCVHVPKAPVPACAASITWISHATRTNAHRIQSQ